MLKMYICWTSSIVSVLQTTQRFARKTLAVLITILKDRNILLKENYLTLSQNHHA